MGKDERGGGRRDSVAKPSGRGPGATVDNSDEAMEVMEMIKGMEVMKVMKAMKAGPVCCDADWHCPSPIPFPHKWNCSPPEDLIP